MEADNNLYQKLLNYVKSGRKLDLQVKPIQHEIKPQDQLAKTNIQAQLQIVKKQKNNQIDHQIYNICQNIAFSFFSLTSDKFYSILQHMKSWGMELCLQHFIMDYYMMLKNDNRLRQFIIFHFNKIITVTRNIIETQLINKLDLQDFTSNNTDIKQLKQKLQKTEKELSQKIPKKSQPAKQALKKVKSQDDADKLKQEILADLKAQNKQLQEI